MNIYRTPAPMVRAKKRARLLDYVSDALGSGLVTKIGDAIQYARSMIIEDLLMPSNTKKITTLGGYDKLRLQTSKALTELSEARSDHSVTRDRVAVLEKENAKLRAKLAKYEGGGFYVEPSSDKG